MFMHVTIVVDLVELIFEYRFENRNLPHFLANLQATEAYTGIPTAIIKTATDLFTKYLSIIKKVKIQSTENYSYNNK